MEILIHKFYKTKNNRIHVIVRDLGFFATQLVSKPTKEKAIEAVAIKLVQDFYQEEDLTIKFVNDPSCEEDISITYYETCYGWEA